MKKLSLILAIVLLISIFSACGKVNTAVENEAAASDDTADVEPTAEPSAEPSASIIMDGKSAPEGMAPLKDVPSDYNAEQAELDGCYVEIFPKNGPVKELNRDVWDKFVEDSLSGNPVSIRKFTDNTEKSETFTVKDIEFDGSKYIVRRYVRERDNIEYESVKLYERIKDHPELKFPEYKSAQEADADGCVVWDGNNQIIYGQELFDSFITNAKNGEPAKYTKVDASSNLPTPITDSVLEYNGEYFIIKYHNPSIGCIESTILFSIYESSVISIQSAKTFIHTLISPSDKFSYEHIMDASRSSYSSGDYEAMIPFVMLSTVSEPLPEEVLKTDWIPEDESHLSDEAHIFTVLPGSSDWTYMEQSERIASCKVSRGKTKGMTTRALIETALNYPYIINMAAYNTIDMGIEMQLDNNTALAELFTRKNAFYEMVMYAHSIADSGDILKTTDLSMLISYYQRNLLTEENNPWPHLID